MAVERVEGNSVTALERGFAVLHCFSAATPALAHGDLARATGLPKATVSRIATVDIRSVARPLMTQLADETRTTVNLSVRNGTSLVVVETVRSEDAVVSVNSRIGIHFPILQTAMGRAWLAGLPVAQRGAAIGELRPTVAAHEARSLEQRVRKGIADCDAKGYCCLLSEWRPGVNSVAAPIRLPGGERSVYVVNCAGPAHHLPAAVMGREAGPRLLKITTQILDSLKETWT